MGVDADPTQALVMVWYRLIDLTSTCTGSEISVLKLSRLLGLVNKSLVMI
jgi:hypothetical protein